jgi:hypothetical protein
MQARLAEAHEIYEMGAGVRDELLAELSDEDLAFRLHGNPSLGELLAEYASVQRTYIDSFTTLRHDWTAIATEDDLATSIERLRERFGRLDEDLRVTLDALGDSDGDGDGDDATGIVIDRGGWQLSAGSQLHTLREAMIITLGKAVVYLRAMDRQIPQQVLDWVG